MSSAERASLMGGPDNASMSPRRNAALWLLDFTLRFTMFWMIGFAVVAMFQLTSDYYVPFWVWLIAHGAAALLATLASASQLGVIWSNSKSLETPNSVRLYYFSGLLQSLFISGLLAATVYLFAYTKDQTSQVDRLYTTTPRSYVQEKLYMLLSLQVVAGVFSLILLLSGVIFSSYRVMKATLSA